ncbi:MAG: acetyl-CoA carboxylase carboxyl transferase subunit alpha [Gemmatimonadetes bacterium]|nr:acetyl-CoA carboxylase carboxyl transferase subunit alpha [Gemmatimonadota bacterium]|tara:strand:+ start:1198 stop:2163 length:966 start_codon:yes stop_codon:yes gene_type:complete
MNTNSRIYLEFEKPLEKIEKKIEEMQAHAESENLDMSAEIASLKERATNLEKDLYENLTRWQKVQVARHPQRPYTMDYIDMMLTDFVELHGDRQYRDDPAIVGGMGRIDGRPIVLIGQQKGRNTKENLHRNFGMPYPEGYRKALRLMKMAEKFSRPVVCLVDTPGAFPGLGSEERNVSEAIGRNLFEMAKLAIPIIIVVIGEGASGGALGIGVGDRILMLENAWYSVINPDSCSLILWRNRDKKEEAADAMKIAAQDLTEYGIVDRVVPEPLGGAHKDPILTANNLKRAIVETLDELAAKPVETLSPDRIDKFCKMGVWDE